MGLNIHNNYNKIMNQITVIHDRNSQQSIDFLQKIPENTTIVDWYCPANIHTGVLRRPARDKFGKRMLTIPQYLEQGGIKNVKTSGGSVLIKVPEYHQPASESDAAKNIPESYYNFQSNTWQEVEDYVDMVNQRAINNPPIAEENLPTPTPVVLPAFNAAVGKFDAGLKAALGEDNE